MCSDRCHDGEFDGPYAHVGRPISQRSWPFHANDPLNRDQTSSRKSNTADTEDGTANDEVAGSYHKYNTWDSSNNQWTNTRLPDEQCDTMNDTTCCDRNCQIVSGCTCTHFYIGIWHSNEYPSFQSLCTNPDDIAYSYVLPTNTFYFQNRGMSQSATVGLNGQLRLLECSDVTTDCFGVTLGQQGTGTSSPYVDYFYGLIQTASST